MARRLFPSEANRVVERVGAAGTAVESGAGALVVVYSDPAGTTLAGIVTTALLPIAGSVLIADAAGRIPDFFGPDGVPNGPTVLYVRVDGSGPQPIECDTQVLIDQLTAALNTATQDVGDLDARLAVLEGTATGGHNTVPAPPDTFTGTASGLVATLSWSAAVDDSGPVDHYVLQRKLAGQASFAQVASLPGTTLTATDNVPAGTVSAEYQVYAVDADQGDGGVAGPVSVTFGAAPSTYDTVPPQVPAAPSLQVASAAAAITATWAAVMDLAGTGQTLAGLKDYLLERSTTSGSAGFTQVAIVPAGQTPARTYVDDDLPFGTQVWYRLRARDNNLNVSAAGPAANVTTVTDPGAGGGGGGTAIDPKPVGATQEKAGRTWKVVTSRNLSVFDTGIFYKENSSAAVNSAIDPNDRSNAEMQKPKVPGLVEVVDDPSASGGKCFSAKTAITDYDVTGGTARGWGNGRWGSRETVTAPCRIRCRIKRLFTDDTECKAAIMFWPEGAWGQNWEMDFCEYFRAADGFNTKYSVRLHGAYPDGNTGGNQSIKDFPATPRQWHIMDLIMLDSGTVIQMDGVTVYEEPNDKHPDLRRSPLFKAPGQSGYYYPHQDGHFCVGKALTGWRTAADMAAHGQVRTTDDIRVDWFEYWRLA